MTALNAQRHTRSARSHAPSAASVAALALIVIAAGAMLGGCARPAGGARPLVARATSSATPAELSVSAATSLKGAFVQLAPAFERASGAKLAFNFGASGVLQRQVEAGAPCDVFASASAKQVDALIAAGLVSADATATFASNDLVIIVPADNPARIASPVDLANAAKLVTGNPDTAPHGTKAKEFLERLGTWRALEPRFVFAENAAQTVDYVSRGEVDAGLVFVSEVLGNRAVKVVYTVPAGAIKPVRYVAAPVKASANSLLAEQFVAYLFTPQAQAILAEKGFKPTPSPAP